MLPKFDGSAFILSVSGKKLDPYNLDIDIKDIAWSLSNLCRWNGHLNSWFSVAEHCVRVSSLTGLKGLLHDASEYVLGDIAGPLKQLIPDYVLLAGVIDKQIEKEFGVCFDAEVKAADKKVLQWEYDNYVIGSKAGWPRHWAYCNFLNIFNVLYV